MAVGLRRSIVGFEAVRLELEDDGGGGYARLREWCLGSRVGRMLAAGQHIMGLSAWRTAFIGVGQWCPLATDCGQCHQMHERANLVNLCSVSAIKSN